MNNDPAYNKKFLDDLLTAEAITSRGFTKLPCESCSGEGYHPEPTFPDGRRICHSCLSIGYSWQMQSPRSPLSPVPVA